MEEFDQKIKVHKFRYSLVGGLFMIGIVVSLSLAGIYRYARDSFFPNQINLTIDLKLINDEGRSVVGADVYMNQEPVGITDSFGEWRDSIVVTPGKGLYLKFNKNEKTVLSKSILAPLSAPFQIKRVLKVPAEKKKTIAIVKDKEEIEVPKVIQSSRRYQLVADKSINVRYVSAFQIKMSSLGMTEMRNARFKIYLSKVKYKNSDRFMRVKAKGLKNDIDFIRSWSKDPEDLVNRSIATLRNHIHRNVSVKRQGKKWFVLQDGPEFWNISDGGFISVGNRKYLVSQKEKIKSFVGREILKKGFSCSGDCVFPVATLHYSAPRKGWKWYKSSRKDYGFVAGYKSIKNKNGQLGYWLPSSKFVNITKLSQKGKVSARYKHDFNTKPLRVANRRQKLAF